jgi:proteasome lid subunit RPN8/RPN11
MPSLKIPNSIFTEMLQQAKAEAPIEACGILAGRDHQVERLYKMENTDNSEDHFLMAPAEQFVVVKDIRSASLEMLAIYHSHPETSARPSEEDIRLALTQNVIYVILSLKDFVNPDIKGFLIKDTSATEVPILVEK